MSGDPGAPDRKVVWFPGPLVRTIDVSAIVYDLKAIGGALRKQRMGRSVAAGKARAESSRAGDEERYPVRPVWKRLLATE
jgi:hypothetical protein